MHVGQAEVPACISVGEFLMIEPEQVQNRAWRSWTSIAPVHRQRPKSSLAPKVVPGFSRRAIQMVNPPAL